MMIDGVEIEGGTHVLALGITAKAKRFRSGSGRLDRERDVGEECCSVA
jgi:hypothetical protein